MRSMLPFYFDSSVNSFQQTISRKILHILWVLKTYAMTRLCFILSQLSLLIRAKDKAVVGDLPVPVSELVQVVVVFQE